MLHGKNVKLFIGILAAAALVVLFVWYRPALLPGEVAAPDDGAAEDIVLESSAEIGGREIIIPSGRQEYQIMQAAERWPKILEAVIDPPDVHVGDTQRLEIVVQSREPIALVEAHIETDNDTVILPLELVGPVADSELLPRRYAILDNGEVGFVGGRTSYGGSTSKTSVALAQGFGGKLKYAGEWIVRDTHDAVYHTTFFVKDASGAENSITLTWTDLCAIPNIGGGAWNWTTGTCTISALEGVSGGTATISGGTLQVDTVFTWDPGSSIVISGSGSIAIAAGAYMTQAYLFFPDTDNDGYQDNSLASSLTTSTSASVSAKVRRANSQTTNDCAVSNASFQWNGYGDGDGDGVIGNTYACNNGSGSPGSDCDDGNINIWQNLTGYQDTDLDTYTIGGATSVCSGSSLPSGWRSSAGSTGSSANSNDCNDSNGSQFYAWVGGTNFWYDDDGDGYGRTTTAGVQACTDGSLPAGFTSNPGADDCYDSNASAYPGQATYWFINRGDGSFDYDCDGGESRYYGTNVTSCEPVDPGNCSPTCSPNPDACQSLTNAPGWHQAFGDPGCGGETYRFNGGNLIGCNACDNNTPTGEYCK